MSGSYLGPEFSQKEIENELNNLGAKFEIFDEDLLISKTVNDLTILPIFSPSFLIKK